MSRVCSHCAEDEHLKLRISDMGKPGICSECQKRRSNTIDTEELACLIEAIIQEHWALGEEVKRFSPDDDDDSGEWVQDGNDLDEVIQEITGQYFTFHEELVDAVIAAEVTNPKHGDYGILDNSSNYQERPVSAWPLVSQWNFIEEDLKHRSRFFNVDAKAFFAEIFQDVEKFGISNRESGSQSVAVTLKASTTMFRARSCDDDQVKLSAIEKPVAHVGPPPPGRAPAGRMNISGVSMLYAALELDTALAELRPYIGGDLVAIKLQTNADLRLLDFTKLSASYKALSYFQTDYLDAMQRSKFLRSLGTLISRPVIPGRESDYLITQAMTEYLALIHKDPFDGMIFRSAQRTDGTNIVLFPQIDKGGSFAEATFPVSYVEDSIRFFRSKAVEYKTSEVKYHIIDGKVVEEHDEWL